MAKDKEMNAISRSGVFAEGSTHPSFYHNLVYFLLHKNNGMSQRSTSDPRLITYTTLRRSIGFIGIFFPAVLIIGARFIGDCSTIQDSISEYYYTIMGDIFVGILCAIAFFLIVYRGYDAHDNFATNLGGLFAVGIALFPTTHAANPTCAFINPSLPGGVDVLHYISAALFFITLAYISFFLFTKSKGEITEMKAKRNAVYKAVGAIIVVCILAIFLLHQIESLSAIATRYKLVFSLEWIALIAFGISWCVKGEVFMVDETSAPH